MARLAREGNFHHVDGPTYFKRARHDSLHAKFHDKDRLWRRAVWLEFGLGMLETIWPLVSENDRQVALAATLDRLCTPKADRFLFYDGPQIPFASDFLSKALSRFPVPVVERAMTGRERTAFAGELAGCVMDRAIAWSNRDAGSSPGEPSNFRFCAGGAGIDLLMQGWCTSAESWGIWSIADIASLRLPVGAMTGSWQASFRFRTFGKKGTDIPIEAGLTGSSTPSKWHVSANEVVSKDFTVEGGSGDVIVQFSLINLKSPLELGVSDDERRLGIGLISMQLSRAD